MLVYIINIEIYIYKCLYKQILRLYNYTYLYMFRRDPVYSLGFNDSITYEESSDAIWLTFMQLLHEYQWK